MASQRKIIQRLLPFLFPAVILTLVMVFYSADYQRPPCCDTAITLSRAEWIVKTGSINPLSPYNPSGGGHLYGSFISTEIVGHLLLALVYWLVPAAVGSLEFAKWFFLVLFALPVIPLFFLARRLLRSSVIAALAVLVAFFGFWYGNMLWSGHVAQMIACSIIPVGVWFLLDFSERPNWKSLLYITGTGVLLFFVHVLSFLLFWIIAVASILITIIPRLTWKQRGLLAGGYFILAALFFLYLFQTPRDLHLLPQFDINSLERPFRDTLTLMLGSFVILLVTLFGAFRALRLRQWMVPIWFFAAYLLSQSQTLGTPFYPSRFDEFIMVPIALLLGMGMLAISSLARQPWLRFGVLAALFVLTIPYAMYWQNQLKKCYVHNCPGLYPTQVPDNDRQAFAWMKQHMTNSDVIIGWPQFAYFIPVVAEKKTELAEGDKRIIFTDPRASVRAAAAKNLGIRYIFWDGIFTEFKNDVRGAEDFGEQPFKQSAQFRLVQEFNGARIYEVR